MMRGIDENADPRCSTIKAQLSNDLGAGNVRIWTDGGSNCWGDRHNGPGVTHISSWATTQSLVEQKNTLIHETAHAIGIGTDLVADSLMTKCFGVLESAY